MPFTGNKFSLLDYSLFAVTLVCSAAVGVFFTFRARIRRNDSPAQVLMGGRDMPTLPTALSLLTSFLSGVTLLAMPAETYQRGVLFWFSRMIGTATALLLLAFVVLPIFYKFRPTSAYQYIQERFGSVLLRRIGALLYNLFTLFYMAVVMYAPAVALSGVTGVSTWAFVLTVGVVCVLYTSYGGLKAVVWTDTLQAGVMFVGVITLFFKGAHDAGGFVHTFKLAWDNDRISGMGNISLNPFQYMTLWGSIFGGIGFWLSMLTFNQIALQRCLSLPNLREARKVILLNIPTYILMMSCADLLGLVIYAYYNQCDPLKAKLIETKDQLVIFFALDVFDGVPGLAGVFLACLFSGTLSTVSSGVNSIAAVTWEDFFSDRYSQIPTANQAAYVKLIGIFLGSLCVMLAFLAKPLGGIIKAMMSMIGATAGPLVGLFLLGIFVPRANSRGAMVGLLVSFTITVWISMGNAVYKPYQGYTLPLSTENCHLWNISIPVEDTAKYVAEAVNASSVGRGSAMWPYSPLEGWPQKLYGISDILYSVIGIAIVVIVGWPASYCFKNDHTHEKFRGLTFSTLHRNLSIVAYDEVSDEDNGLSKNLDALEIKMKPQDKTVKDESHLTVYV